MQPPIKLDFEKFTEPGLYLLFDDGLFLTLTRDFIDKMTQGYLEDPRLLPCSVREAPEYAPCSICPKKHTALMCHAIPTVFPFLDTVDRFLSHEKVLAIYRPESAETPADGNAIHVARTSVQRALQYTSILSLMYYCEVGLAYFKYFEGVIPFMDPFVIMERVYLNMYWDLGGELPAINALTAKMRDEMDVTVRCQMARLRLFCRSDAFINAFVNTHIVTQFLGMDMEKLMRKRFVQRSAAV
ncbi:MAG: hypothetical protein P4L99_21205 [Chthoniobacter sp.]|nr:hypothetical protein [Chthoniobacter sp.]